jgi:hypothetical protein
MDEEDRESAFVVGLRLLVAKRPSAVVEQPTVDVVQPIVVVEPVVNEQTVRVAYQRTDGQVVEAVHLEMMVNQRQQLQVN